MPRRSTFHPDFVIFSSSPSRLASLNPPPPLCYRDELLCAQPVRYFRLLRGNVLVFLIQKGCLLYPELDTLIVASPFPTALAVLW